MNFNKPTFVLDEQKSKANLQRMANKASRTNITFRPHFKTHQSALIGEWFREVGVDKITVSSMGMAQYFAGAGWKDILVAFPVNILEINQISVLAAKIKLSLLVENVEAIRFLSTNLLLSVNIYIKIDTGYHRTGIAPENEETISEILSMVQNSAVLKFSGFLTHAGHTYQARSKKEILGIHTESVKMLQYIKVRYQLHFPDTIISVGDTPSCSQVDDFAGIDEIRPGNFIFYDVMQQQLGSCLFSDIAVAVMCPVVAIHKHRNEIVIYGGAVHLSKEYIILNNEKKSFGMVVLPEQNGWSKPIEHTFVKSISQEHGIIKSTESFLDQVKVGDVIGILPIHSCLTANLPPFYYTTKGIQISRYHIL